MASMWQRRNGRRNAKRWQVALVDGSMELHGPDPSENTGSTENTGSAENTENAERTGNTDCPERDGAEANGNMRDTKGPGPELRRTVVGVILPVAGATRGKAVAGTAAAGASAHVVIGDEDYVRVNGQPLSLGIRQLRDRDEILVRDPTTGLCHRSYFTTEQLVAVEPFPEGASGSCPRCRETLVVGRPAVRCPHCGVWHHQDVDAQHPCWTYAERCASCHDQQTALDAGFRWTPEDLSPEDFSS